MTLDKRIRVLIADDHAVMRCGLAAFVRRSLDLDLVGEAANGKEAVELALKLRPDVVLMDMMMPVMDGVTATRTIRRKRPRTQVLALTNFLNADMLVRALDAGAIGYLLKTIQVDELAAAIRSAYEYKATFAPEAEEQLVIGMQNPHLSALTGREREVLHCMARGMTNAQIAERLTISLWTVKKHVSNIFAKLKTTNRAEVIAFAYQHRLLAEWHALP
jgi:NarL family two-component system response regulator LiaR